MIFLGATAEGLLREAEQDNGILARRKQQHRPPEFGDDFADDVPASASSSRSSSTRRAFAAAVRSAPGLSETVMSAAPPSPHAEHNYCFDLISSSMPRSAPIADRDVGVRS